MFSRRKEPNYFAPVTAVDAKVVIDCNDRAIGIEFAHPDETKIGEVRIVVLITAFRENPLREEISGGPPLIAPADAGSAAFRDQLWPPQVARE